MTLAFDSKTKPKLIRYLRTLSDKSGTKGKIADCSTAVRHVDSFQHIDMLGLTESKVVITDRSSRPSHTTNGLPVWSEYRPRKMHRVQSDHAANLNIRDIMSQKTGFPIGFRDGVAVDDRKTLNCLL